MTLPQGSAAFLDLHAEGAPHAAKLEPVRVLRSSPRECVVEWPLPPLPEGLKLALLYEDPGAGSARFRRVQVEVAGFEGAGLHGTVRLRAAGESQTAERRGAPRLPTSGRGLHARLGDPAEHTVMELGPAGFGVVGEPGLVPGQQVAAMLMLGGDRIACDVVIKNVRPLPDGAARYGVLCQRPSSGDPPFRFVDLYAAFKHGITEPLHSDFEHDPEMCDLVHEFANEILKFAAQAEDLCHQRAYPELRTLAHGLKGAGGGYGFSRITEVAAELEQALIAVAPESEVRECTEKLLVVLRSVRTQSKSLIDA